jgi:integrase
MSTKMVRGKRFWGYGRTPEEADEDLKLAMTPRLTIQSTQLTLGRFFDEVYLPTKISCKPSTIHRYKGSFNLHIRPTLGALPLDQITRAKCQTWLNWLLSVKIAGKTPAANTVNFSRSLLGSVLALAVQDGLISSNPVLSTQRAKGPGRRIRVLSPSEALDLIEFADQTPLAAPVYLAVMLGLRRGEIIGLKWIDLNRRAKTLRIERQVSDYSRREERLKTASSARVIPLTQEIVDGIDQRGNLDSVYICTNHVGNRWHPNRLTDAWRTMAKELGMQEWAFHDLRHAAAGLLVAAGCDLLTVAAILGHANPDMSLIYASSSEELRRSGMERLSKMLSEK